MKLIRLFVISLALAGVAAMAESPLPDCVGDEQCSEEDPK